MAEKLNWVYNDQSTEQHAFVGTDIRIRAVRDDDASNPFDGDGHWPLSVRSPDGHGPRSTFTDYGDDAVASVRNPLGRIGDAELIHMQVTTEVLRGTIDLYGAWAWGDCYGYIIERVHLDDDGDVDDELTEELESCWGYYGSDHGDSGLEESALAACPKEDHRALLEA